MCKERKISSLDIFLDVAATHWEFSPRTPTTFWFSFLCRRHVIERIWIWISGPGFKYQWPCNPDTCIAFTSRNKYYNTLLDSNKQRRWYLCHFPHTTLVVLNSESAWEEPRKQSSLYIWAPPWIHWSRSLEWCFSIKLIHVPDDLILVH